MLSGFVEMFSQMFTYAWGKCWHLIKYVFRQLSKRIDHAMDFGFIIQNIKLKTNKAAIKM